MKLYIISKNTDTWQDINKTLSHGFKNIGFDTEIVHNADIINLNSDSIYFIAGHAETLDHHLVLKNKFNGFDISKKKCTIALFYFERYPLDNELDNVSSMVSPMRNALIKNSKEGWYDYIFSAERGFINTMKSDGVKAKYLQYGYHESYNCLTPETKFTNFGDVVFCGCMSGPSQRRTRIIQKLSKFHKINVMQQVWNETRNAAYRNSKIILNLGYDVPLATNINRLLYSMSNRSLTISEPIKYLEPFENGVHLITAPIDEIPDAIEYYLNHENEREEIINNAYNYVTNHLRIEDTLKVSVKKYLKPLGSVTFRKNERT